MSPLCAGKGRGFGTKTAVNILIASAVSALLMWGIAIQPLQPPLPRRHRRSSLAKRCFTTTSGRNFCPDWRPSPPLELTAFFSAIQAQKRSKAQSNLPVSALGAPMSWRRCAVFMGGRWVRFRPRIKRITAPRLGHCCQGSAMCHLAISKN